MRKSYSYELKKEAVELYFEGFSASYVANKLDISSRTLVNDWVKQVKVSNTFDVLLPNQGRPRKNSKKKETIVEENERLKLENLYLKKLLELKRG
ncbi:transposase [Ureibacillus composti]|nr:transposase [Ureibacillus composti]MDM5332770.1 transposase [Ureibacillus composti]MDM5333242.1 transposase [Ureibacillus composti]